MARVDSLFFFSGLVCTIILFSTYYKKIIYKNYKYLYLKVSLAGVFLAISILSKQTALFYFFYSLFIIYYFSDKPFFFKSFSIFSFACITIFTLYVILINKNTIDYFIIGLKGFGSSFSFISFKNHIKEIIFNCFGYLLLIFLGLYSLRNEKRILKFWILSFAIILLFSFKLFGNIGAFFNNFILFSSTTVIFISLIYKRLIDTYNYLLINLILIFSVSNSIYPNFYLGKIKNSFDQIKAKQTYNGDLEKNKIYKYVLNSEGRFLSGRNDNILHYADKNIFYENSVFSSIMPPKKNIFNIKTYNSIKKLEIDIKDKITKQYFDGIIDGIGNNLSYYKPLINKYYKIYMVDTIYSGFHKHNLVLYIKKS